MRWTCLVMNTGKGMFVSVCKNKYSGACKPTNRTGCSNGRVGEQRRWDADYVPEATGGARGVLATERQHWFQKSQKLRVDGNEHHMICRLGTNIRPSCTVRAFLLHFTVCTQAVSQKKRT